jgi:serine/threonine protein kinase
MSSRPTDYQPGQQIPGTVYRVLRVLGAGGMGTVYDVEDTTVGKRFVLKTLHGNLADRADLAERLTREARTLAKLHHPSIVEVFTAGRTQDHLSLPFYVMEKLNGTSLREVMNRRGRLQVKQAIDIAIDLLDALDHAHEHGVVHRDVKPDNIFLHKNLDGSHVAKLLDFGIVKVLSSTKTTFTGGRFIGTFRYASPEQITGKDVVPQSDLYSAALTLYEMVAGRGPFDDFTGEIEIGKAHATEIAPRLSRFVPDVAPELDALVASALDKDPARRPKDAFAFAAALRDIKRGGRSAFAMPSDTQAPTAMPVLTSATTRPREGADPSTQGGATHDVVTPRMDGSPEAQPTMLASPQAMVAPTSAGAPPSTTNPYGGQVFVPPSSGRIRGAHTLQDGAPPPMTMVPSQALPQPLAPAIDRNAPTHVSQESAPRAPSYDTQPIPLSVHVARSEPPPPLEMRAPLDPNAGPSTFGAQTTDVGQRRSSAKWVPALAAALGLVVVLALGGGALLWKTRRDGAVVAAPPSPAVPVATADPQPRVEPVPTEAPSAVATMAPAVAASALPLAQPTARATHATAPPPTAPQPTAPQPTAPRHDAPPRASAPPPTTAAAPPPPPSSLPTSLLAAPPKPSASAKPPVPKIGSGLE